MDRQGAGLIYSAKGLQQPLWVKSRHFATRERCPLYPKADMCSATPYVRFVPIADIGQVSLYNLVCLYEYVRWNCKTETCRRLQVNNQFKSRRLLYRQVAGLLTF